MGKVGRGSDEKRDKIPPSGGFERFYADNEPRLRRALVARLGPELGREAALDALSFGWERWNRVGRMENPVGYLFRVASRRSIPRRKAQRLASDLRSEESEHAQFEPALPRALAQLTNAQRTAVLLNVAWGYPTAEVARMLNLSESTVRTHVKRGLARLQRLLEVEPR
ncbi:MAG: RNA polymerase sigma factor [Acidimicrobiales bacterium]